MKRITQKQEGVHSAHQQAIKIIELIIDPLLIETVCDTCGKVAYPFGLVGEQYYKIEEEIINLIKSTNEKHPRPIPEFPRK